MRSCHRGSPRVQSSFIELSMKTMFSLATTCPISFGAEVLAATLAHHTGVSKWPGSIFDTIKAKVSIVTTHLVPDHGLLLHLGVDVGDDQSVSEANLEEHQQKRNDNQSHR